MPAMKLKLETTDPALSHIATIWSVPEPAIARVLPVIELRSMFCPTELAGDIAEPPTGAAIEALLARSASSSPSPREVGVIPILISQER